MTINSRRALFVVLVVTIIALLGVWGVAYYASKSQVDISQLSSEQLEALHEKTVTLISETGTVLRVSTNELSMMTEDGVEKRVVVGPGVRVYKQSSPADATSTRIEISLDRLVVGESIDVSHRSINPDFIDRIDSITSLTEEPVETYFKDILPTIVVKIANLDLTKRTLSYSLIDQNGNLIDSPSLDVTLDENIRVTQVDNLDRARLSHARTGTNITLADINPGDIIALVMNPVSQFNAPSTANMLVVLANQ